MTTLAEVRNLVSIVLDDLGADSYEARVDKNTWRIAAGSVSGFIFLIEDQANPQSSSIVIGFPVMKIPAEKVLPFYRRLLEYNYVLSGRAAFAINDSNLVILHAGRLILDLDASELRDLILRTASIADHYDDILLNEFGQASTQ